MSIDLKDTTELRKYLDKIHSIFGSGNVFESVFAQEDNTPEQKTGIFRNKFFHATTGSNHSLSFDGHYNPQGHLGQAELVQTCIRKAQAKKILELASGKGLNSLYLAHRNPKIDFVGIDLTPEHVSMSLEKAKGLSNLTFQAGDFHKLHFEDSSFDLVFEMESICHSTDMEKALKEALRILKPGGHFVAIESFRNPAWETFSDDLKNAAQISDVVLGIGNPWKVNEWQQLCEKIGFKVVETEDLSPELMPNLLRQRELAKVFFKFPWLTRFFLRILPYTWLQNAILGSLTLSVVSANVQSYYKIVLVRQ